ncbi:ChaN family lipoprotein [Aestuariirhabdus sp. LZHN29]|uniref:ChaN family lipoprotein n=1 Tax=Aestuariirhabdus sp. LZHN29 TaxID=3417462 RepID=UPI003CEAA2C8
MKMGWFTFGVGVVLMLTGCVSRPPIIVAGEEQLQQWQAPLNREAPGLGNIWSYPREQWIEPKALVHAISQTDYLMLGEKHDNPDHHRIQWYLLDQLGQQKRLGMLTLEMLKQGQQPLVDSAAQLEHPDLSELKQHLRWDQVRGWDWHFYGPLMLLALEQGAPLRAGNLDAGRIKEIYAQQDSGAPLLASQQQARVQGQLEKQIIASHCGQAEGDHLQAMVRVQQHRDQSMAEAIMAPDAVSVLVAGAYHVRRDLGVPLYLQRLQPDAKLISLAMVELSDASDGGVGDAVERLRGIYDYLWFTPKMPRPDYCADWAKHSRGG